MYEREEVDNLIVVARKGINITDEHKAALLVAAKSFTPGDLLGSLGFTHREIRKPEIVVLNDAVVCIKKEHEDLLPVREQSDLKALQLSLIKEGKINITLPWPKIARVEGFALNAKERELFFECLKRPLQMHYVYERVVREWYFRGVS